MKRFILYLSILFIGLAGMVSAQNVVVSLPDTSVTIGAKTLNIPMLVQNFNNIGAISLKINYNSAVLKFNGIANAPTTGFTVNADSASGVIAIGWFSSDGKTPINIGNGKLLDLVFDYTSGSSPLSFVNTQSEVSDINGITKAVTFTNGSISSPVKVSLDNVKASPGDTVRVPLRGYNLSNVGSISLKITYDATVLNYVGLKDDSVGFTSGGSNGTLTLGWYSSNNQPYSLSSGIMAQLVFVYVNNSTPLSFFTFNGQTEITDLSGNVINVTYMGGSVSKDFAISLPTKTSGANQDIDFPLSVKDMSVGSASLKISFDPNVLTFKNVIDSTGGTLSANASNGVLTIGYFNTSPKLTNGKLLDLEFSYKTGSSNLTFNQAQCEITDGSGSKYSGYSFVDGAVSLRANRKPYFTESVADTNVTGYDTLLVPFAAADSDAGQTLTFLLVNNIYSNATISPTTGWLRFIGKNLSRKYTIKVGVTDGIDTTTTTLTISSIVSGIVIYPGGNIPKDYGLSQNYPNPFNPSTNIDFTLPKESKVVLKIYNLLGQEVATLLNQEMSAGSYKYEFNANKLSSGIYIYRLQAGNYTFTKKMTLLK